MSTAQDQGELESQTLDELAGDKDSKERGGAPAQNAPAGKGRGGRRRRSPTKPPDDPPPAQDEETGESLDLGPVGLAAITLEQRRYSAQGAGSMVASGAARAEGQRGGNSDLVIIAVEPGRGLELLDELRAALTVHE